MPVKFFEITDDPYKNTSNEFVLVLSITEYGVPYPSAPGSQTTVNGMLVDPRGIEIGYMWVAWYQDYEVTGSLSDEAFAHSYVHNQNTMLIPPGFTFKNFSNAICLQGTLEELAPFIRGM